MFHNDSFNFIERTLKEHTIVIFSKQGCPLCDKIKKELRDSRTDYKEMNVSTLDDEYSIDGLEVVDILKSITKSNQFPFCFKDTEYHSVDDLIKKLIVFNNELDI